MLKVDLFSDIGEVLQREHDALKELAARIYSQHAHLVELSQTLKTKTTPNEHAFFRSQSKEDSQTPASAVVRPVLGGVFRSFLGAYVVGIEPEYVHHICILYCHPLLLHVLYCRNP